MAVVTVVMVAVVVVVENSKVDWVLIRDLNFDIQYTYTIYTHMYFIDRTHVEEKEGRKRNKSHPRFTETRLGEDLEVTSHRVPLGNPSCPGTPLDLPVQTGDSHRTEVLGSPSLRLLPRNADLISM